MERKKILWLCSWYPSDEAPFNGDFIQRHAHAAALYHDIFVLHVFAGQQSSEMVASKDGLTEQLIAYKKSFSFFRKLTHFLSWYSASRKAIRNYVASNGVPDLVHVHVPVKAGLLALRIKKKYGVPFFVTEHWGIYNSIVDNGYTSKSFLFKLLTKKVFTEATMFLSVSEYLAKGVNQLVCKKEFRLIPNTVDSNLFYYKRKDKTPFRFIHVSNMVPLKNVKGILDAFKVVAEANEQVELVMAGNMDDSMEMYAMQIGLPRQQIKFVGEIEYATVANEMQQADCLVLFSNIENSPCVIGEALCCGLPVIATAVGGIPELVDKSNAVLIEPGAILVLSDTMQSMISNHFAFDQKKIAEEAKSRFSNNNVGKKINEAYQKYFSAT